MRAQEKLVIQMLLKYFQMLNRNMGEMHQHLQIAEAVIKQSPDLLAKYEQMAKGRSPQFHQGLNTQLSAIEQEVHKLLD